MWVLLRVLTALVVGLVRFCYRGKFKGEEHQAGGVTWLLRRGRQKGRVVSHEIAVPLQSSIYFRLTKESAVDRFFKAVGFTHEIQTGDAAFDATVYVACDHPAVTPVLQESSETRRAIQSLFALGYDRIQADGRFLRAYRGGSVPPDGAQALELARVAGALQSVPVDELRLLRDRFFWRALLVESLAWSLAFYAAPTIAEIAARPHPLYFDLSRVVQAGLVAAVGLWVLMMALAWALLRGSSRSHRVLTESAVLLIFGVPLAAIQMVSDVNVHLDRTAPVAIERSVTEKYTTISRSKSGTRTHYHVRLATSPAPFPMPAAIEVSLGIFQRAGPGSKITIQMHPGRLRIPWVESIRSAR